MADIDSLVNAHLTPGGPGVAVAVIKDGSVVHSKGYNLADMEWNISIAPDTVFGLGSLTKPITALAILMLEKQGKLNISHPITDYLPDYPTHGHTITIAHLLSHTSGIPNFVTLPGFFENEAQKDHSPEELSKLFRDLPLDFTPGTGYGYSNSGYAVLGMLIEALSGKSYAEFIEQDIFGPLGMSHSHYMSSQAIIPKRAHGYNELSSGYENAPYISSTLAYSAGGLGSTLEDLIRFDEAIREYRLFDRGMQERSYTPTTLLDGRHEYYGLGWALSDYRQHRVVHHAGGIPGFSSFYGRFMQEKLSIIVLSNSTSFSAGRLARSISSLLLDIQPLTVEPAEVDAHERRKLVGTFSNTLRYETVAVEDDGQNLSLSGFMNCRLLPRTETVWYSADDADIEVEFSDLSGERYNRVLVRYPFYWFEVTRLPDPEL